MISIIKCYKDSQLQNKFLLSSAYSGVRPNRKHLHVHMPCICIYTMFLCKQCQHYFQIICSTNVCVYVYIYIYIYICVCVCVCVCMCVCMYIHIYMYTCVYVCIYINMYMYLCVYIYVYMYLTAKGLPIYSVFLCIAVVLYFAIS